MLDPSEPPELRNPETIQAYLEELSRLKAPVHLHLGEGGEIPFETTLERVGASGFSTTTTPPLAPGDSVGLSFMMDARRFTARAHVQSRGVFSLPQWVRFAERRAHPRGVFEAADRAEAFALEGIAGTFAHGRTVLGKILDLTSAGLRIALERAEDLDGRDRGLVPGLAFQAVRIRDLPFLPPIQCLGTLVHVTVDAAGVSAGLSLLGLADTDRRNLERILARRFPATFGQVFPSKKRKTDLADLPGTPTPTQVRPREAEVVELPQAPPQPAPPRRERPPITAAQRLRKPIRKILFLSTHPGASALARAMREDGFRQVHEARTFLEAQHLAERLSFDLVFLDIHAGGHWGRDMMRALRSHHLLLDASVILLADERNDTIVSTAVDLEAIHVHEHRESYDDLAPILYRLLLEREA